jgi:hypothetical protein
MTQTSLSPNGLVAFGKLMLASRHVRVGAVTVEPRWPVVY